MRFQWFAIGLWSLAVCLFLFPNPSHAEHLLRVGTYAVNAHQKLIVLGIRSSSNEVYDFASLGFRGREIDSIQPKFLLELNDGEVEDIRAFELDRFAKDEVFLKVSEAKKAQRGQAARAALHSVLKALGFPFSTAAILAELPRRQLEKERQLQAYYLLELINQALPPTLIFSELNSALSSDPLTAEEQLRKIGQAILTRYNPINNRAGLKVPEGMGEFFEVWRKTQVGLRSKNKGYIMALANGRRLRVAAMGDLFGIVFLEASAQTTAQEIQDQLEHLRFVGLGLDKKDSAKIAEIANQYAIKKGALVPWYLVSFSHESGPVDLANFISPRTFVRKLRNQTSGELAGDLGGSLVPLGSWVTKAIRKSLAKKNQFQGRTNFLRRTPSYGSILALTETRAYDLQFSGAPLDRHEIIYEQLNLALSKMGVDPRDNDLNQNRYVTPSDALNEASALLLKAEREGAHLSAKAIRRRLAQGVLDTEQATETDRVYRQNALALARAAQAIKAANMSFLVQTLEADENSGPRATPREEPPSPSRGRGPASLAPPVTAVDHAGERKPVIVFLVDGLRPDRFRIAASQGLLPNLSGLFYKKGVDLESVASRSLTLPSWATMFTGFEPDYHGLKSNTPGSRLEQKITENYTDPRKDLLHIRNWIKNRAFQRLEEDKTGEENKTWFPGYYRHNEVLFNHMPIVNGPTRSLGKILNDYLTRQPEYSNKIRFEASALDITSGQVTAAKINKDARGKNKLRLVMNWYAGVDEASHYNNSILPFVYAEIDRAVGMVLAAARSHPVLKDATVILLSDHGHTGGYGPFSLETSLGIENEESNWSASNPPLMRNTGLNLTKFLAGQNYGYPNYNLVVGAALPPEPKYDFSMYSTFLTPYNITYPIQFRRPTALVDCSGDNIAQVYFKGASHWKRLSLNQMADFAMDTSTGTSHKVNVISDLLELEVPNLMVTHPLLSKRIHELSQNHPVALIGVGLPGEEARLSADALGARIDTFASTRDPVLVLARSQKGDASSWRTGLILTRSDLEGNDQFRYLVLKNFQQSANGKILGTPSTEPEDDPLNYLGIVEGTHQFHQWRSDREWLARAHHHRWPSAIFTMARILTLAPKYSDMTYGLLSKKVQAARQAEIPDLILIANPGYSFQSDEPMESDHGGLAREEIFNSFFISSLKKEAFPKYTRIRDYPVLTRDVMPTVLAFAGMGGPGFDLIPKTQGKNLKPWLEELLQGGWPLDSESQ